MQKPCMKSQATQAKYPIHAEAIYETMSNSGEVPYSGVQEQSSIRESNQKTWGYKPIISEPALYSAATPNEPGRI